MMATSTSFKSESENGETLCDSRSASYSIMKLNKPNLNNPATLMDAFQNRQTTRMYSDKPVSEQALSDLMWVAAGINRKDGGKTVPLLGDIAIYAALENGVYLYDPVRHELKLKVDEDIRGKLSPQDIVREAPLVLIMTIDDSSFPAYMKKAMEEAHGMDFYYGNQVAYSTQNVYLYACSNNMNAQLVGQIYKEDIDNILDLPSGHHSYLIQLVGYQQ